MNRAADRRLKGERKEEMKKAGNLKCAAVSFLIAFALPLLAVKVFRSDAGLAVALLLFFAVNPAAAIGIGIFSGRRLRTFWFQPVLFSLLFLLGVWAFFDNKEPLWLRYALIYLLLGCVSMLITALVVKLKQGTPGSSG